MTTHRVTGIDLQSLHYLLWKRADQTHTLRIDKTDLGNQLGVNRNTVGRKISALVKIGALIAPPNKKHQSNVRYTVVDPLNIDAVTYRSYRA